MSSYYCRSARQWRGATSIDRTIERTQRTCVCPSVRPVHPSVPWLDRRNPAKDADADADRQTDRQRQTDRHTDTSCCHCIVLQQPKKQTHPDQQGDARYRGAQDELPCLKTALFLARPAAAAASLRVSLRSSDRAFRLKHNVAKL